MPENKPPTSPRPSPPPRHADTSPLPAPRGAWKAWCVRDASERYGYFSLSRSLKTAQADQAFMREWYPDGDWVAEHGTFTPGAANGGGEE